METIQYLVEEGICCIALNRPEVRNAFNSSMTFELSQTLEALNQDDDVRAVIITGNGKAFSAGADISEGVGMWDKLRSEREAKPIPDLLIQEFNKPVIAAINGAAIGFGLTITLSCDIRVAAESALMFAEQRKRERRDFDKCLKSDEVRAMRERFQQLKKE